MTTRRHALLAAAILPAASAGAATPPAWPAADEITRREEEVKATEIAFAKTLADRDAAAFKRFLAPDTIWKGQAPLRGPEAVAAAWAKFFEGPNPPFAWGPDTVFVLPSGDLAQTSGPVTSPDGKVVARFQSVWRRKPAGGWEIVFDQGSEVCH